MPRLLVFGVVSSPAVGFDWGLGAFKWWRFFSLMLVHYDWTLNDSKGNRWAVLWWRSEDALSEFYEGACK